MKFKSKTKIVAEIPTASMPDIIFMLLIFFMVTTVLRTYEGLNVFLPQAKKIQKLEETKRHIAHVFVSRDGLISIDDKIISKEEVDRVMRIKRTADPKLVVSLKADKDASMELINEVHSELREADALKVNYSSKLKSPQS